MNQTLLRVATFIYKPYQSFAKTGINVRVDGFYGNVLEALVSSLNFRYEIINAGAWGNRLANGTWTGAFGALQREEADITLCPTNPSAEHLPLAEQSPGLHPTEIVILAGRRSRFQSNAFGILMTFPATVWLSLVCSVILVGLIMALIHWTLVRPLEGDSLGELGRDYIFTLIGNTWQQGAPVSPPPYDSLRLVWMSWYLAVSLILMYTFAGQVKAAMMFKPEKERIDSLRNLNKLTKVKMYVPKDSIVDKQLKNHVEPWGRSLYQRIQRQGTAGNAAFIFHSNALKETVHSGAVIIASRIAVAKAADPYCAVMPAGEFYVARHSMYSFQGVIHLSRSTLDEVARKNILLRLNWLSDGGLLSKWVTDISGSWEGCTTRSHTEQHEALEIDDLEGLFYILLMVFAVAIVVLVIENVFSSLTSGRKPRSSTDSPP